LAGIAKDGQVAGEYAKGKGKREKAKGRNDDYAKGNWGVRGGFAE